MCISPICVKMPAGYRYAYEYVPCGRCFECMEARASSWRFRLEQEFLHSTNCRCVTLTYDEDHIYYKDDHYFCFVKSDVQKFVRALRDWFRYQLKVESKMSKDDIKEYMSNFKYFIVSEYGGKTGRPHYHALFFNFPIFPPFVTIRDVEEKIIDLWKYGNPFFGNLDMKTINYCVNYLFKLSDIDIPDTADKPFMLCSQGIGKCYITPEVVNYHRQNMTDFIVQDGIRKHVPRYLKLKIFTDDERKFIGEKNQDEQLKRHFDDKEKLGDDFYRIMSYRSHVRIAQKSKKIKHSQKL